MKTCLIAILVILSTASLWAADEVGRNAPTQQIVRLSEDGKLTLVEVHITCMPYTEEVTIYEDVTVEVNGKTEVKKVAKKLHVTKTKMVPQLAPRIIDANLAKLFETDGRPVDLKAAGKRLQKPTLVVRSQDGKMIAPYYASVFKPGTLILSVTESQANTTLGIAPAQPVGAVRTPRAVTLVSQAEPPAAPQPPAPLKLDVAPPKTVAPVLMYARVPAPNKLNLRSYSEGQAEKEFPTEVTHAGKPEYVMMKQLQKYTRSESTQLDLEAVSALTADGKAVAVQRLPDLLKAATTVFVMTDGQSPDSFWLTNVKPSVLVLVTPQGLVGGGYDGSGSYAAPVMAPAAPRTSAPVEIVPPPQSTPTPTPSPK